MAQAEAETALAQFLDKLAEGEYSDAAELFGGSYEELRYLNPRVPENDFQTLWRNGCQINGFQCLPLLRVIEAEETNSGEYLFTVELKDESGDTYEQGPCCGSSDNQTISRFEFQVIQSNGNFLVVNMPPFLP